MKNALKCHFSPLSMFRGGLFVCGFAFILFREAKIESIQMIQPQQKTPKIAFRCLEIVCISEANVFRWLGNV